MSVVEEEMRGPIKVMDTYDPIFDSESEDEDCLYTVIDVAADEYRQALNKTSCFSGAAPPTKSHLSLDEFTKLAKEILDNYFVNRETFDLSKALEELNCSQYLDSFLVLAIQSSLHRSTDEQRCISASLTLLVDKHLISKQQMVRAFEKLIQSASSIDLDTQPNPDRVYLFLDCAVLDGCVDESYVRRLPEKFLDSLSPETLDASGHLVESLQNLKTFKEAVRNFLPDFFNSGSVEEMKFFLDEQNQPLLQHEFVKMVVEASFSKENEHREMVSNALDRLYGKLLKPDDIQLAFARLVGDVEDDSLDNPDVYYLLAKFLARAVADEILPPSFLVDRYRLNYGGDGGMQVLKQVQKWLVEQNGKGVSVRLRKVWTGTDPDNAEACEFKARVRECLYEYFDSNDKQEAARILRELELSPDQAAEMVRKLLVISMEKAAAGEPTTEHVFALLSYLLERTDIDEEMIQKGFEQTRNLTEEIKLDIPDMDRRFPQLVEEAKKRDMLPAGF
ncbi:Pdcd4-prov protein, related [Neospora caninum Liverpool]|uniref:Pdcd4-prov protein, related n=1 Tax=Neospora caninum (strain Liverpool) TaxID=572307 RepID=F0VD82_NEOCL|nr:Pdcd4-prov protein, related [Neospora caninum Liverpool]CBZ51597.1 Pdcd4-prov protein, related [Neospora caninum Liverpool]CEL65548.1 TPA: Pdcd4-prov protein, related [Neospora caninum Liverpool]|eukprot:XP_003881630.1 Pdcd4-prov protein, related [Neospora caninum Liverpool]